MFGIFVLLFGLSAHADFAATRKIEGVELKRLGTGLRKVDRMGFRFKVYEAALYVDPSVQAAGVEADTHPKYLELVMLRSVDKKDMNEAWADGMYKNCQLDCEHYREQLKPIQDMMVDLVSGSKIQLTFLPTGVTLRIEGREIKRGNFLDPNLSKNLLRVFIGPKPPDPDLKTGLLGG